MIRKALFWTHLFAGVTAGLFIFIMAATGVLLSFEKQVVSLVDRDIRFVSIPNDTQPLPLNQLLEVVRQAGIGEPTAIVLRNQTHASAQFSIGRGKTVYVDPYTGAVLGPSSARAHDFFFAIERLHRALGAPLGRKSVGRWLAGTANLMFAILIPLGIFLWLPRTWSRKSVRAVSAFRWGLRGRARDWNWHNAIGIWCALPLLVIALSGVVMSFEWANALLFRLSGSPLPAFGRDGGGRGPRGPEPGSAAAPNYDQLFLGAKALDPAWKTITLNITRDGKSPVGVAVDKGSGAQPQKRVQYQLDRDSGEVLRKTSFADGSLGQRLRSFVRFGHTGEFGGIPGQLIAGLASLGACVLAYTGLALSIRRLAARMRRNRSVTAAREVYAEQSSV